MAGYERVVTESPDRESASRADGVHAQLPPGRSAADDLAGARVPPALRSRDHARAKSTRSPRTGSPISNRLVIVAAPEAAGVVLPDQAQLAAAVRTATTKRLEAYVDAGAGQALMDAPPARGTIVKTTARPDGITEWTLSNGATVVLKPTTLKEDQILFRAFAPGGTSLASDADFIPARSADDVVPAGGVGEARRGDARQDPHRQGGRRQAVHRRNGAGDGRRQHAAGSRNDVPAAPPALHAAARRSGRVRRAGLAGARAARQPRTRAPTSCSTRRSTPRSAGTARAGSRRRARDGGQVEPRRVAGVLQGALRGREPLHVRLRRQLHARDAQAARRDLPRQPAGDAHAARPGATSASRRRPASSRRRSRWASRRRARWRSSSRGRSSTTISAHPGAADDDAAAAVAAVRQHPAGARRHLQHHRHADARRRFRSRNTACGSSGRAIPRAPRRWCSACSRRSRRQGELHLARADGADPRGAAARVPAEQPGERLRPQRDRAPLRGRRRRRGASTAAGPDRRADRRRDPAGGADLSEDERTT